MESWISAVLLRKPSLLYHTNKVQLEPNVIVLHSTVYNTSDNFFYLNLFAQNVTKKTHQTGCLCWFCSTYSNVSPAVYLVSWHHSLAAGVYRVCVKSDGSLHLVTVLSVLTCGGPGGDAHLAESDVCMCVRGKLWWRTYCGDIFMKSKSFEETGCYFYHPVSTFTLFVMKLWLLHLLAIMQKNT